jgi:hypothetical protein
MSDNTPAHILIGGNLPTALLQEFYKAVELDSPALEYGDATPDIETLRAHIQKLGDDCLDFQDDQARVGDEMTNLIAFCRKHNLTYVLHADAKYEYDAELRWWKPGMDDERVCTSTQTDDAMVNVQEVAKAMAEPDPLRHIQKLIDDNTPCQVPAFRLV